MVVRAVVSHEATVFWYETVWSCPPAKGGLLGGHQTNPRSSPVAGFWQEDIKRIRGELRPRTGPPELVTGDSLIAILCSIFHSV
jgi:hypothetical protein